MLFWLIISATSLLCITWQDFRDREVVWWLFPTAFIGLIGIHKVIYDRFLFPWQILVNLCICLLICSLTCLTYILRKRLTGLKLLSRSIGLGDIVMVPLLLYYFSPMNLILFFISSLIIALTAHIIISFGSSKAKSIPLAGYWALLLLPLIILNGIGAVDVKNDNWIYLCLMNY